MVERPEAPETLPCEAQTMPPACEQCQGEGRLYRLSPTYFNPVNEVDDGVCPSCNGSGELAPTDRQFCDDECVTHCPLECGIEAERRRREKERLMAGIL